jgi:hypothetical protein
MAPTEASSSTHAAPPQRRGELAESSCMRSKSQVTDVVMPLDDEGDDETVRDDHDCELDWCFDDPELTQQLKAVKGGRGVIVTIAIACTLMIGAAVGLAI